MWNLELGNDGITYASALVSNFSFLLAIVIGVIATLLVFRAARKMGGGLFGSVLQFLSIGMAFIVIGAVSVVFEPPFDNLWFNLTRTLFFSLGFVFLVLGADKLLKGITQN